MVDLAKSFEGQLTATPHMDEGDATLARRLLPGPGRKADRVLVDGLPAGAEVADAMIDGGPHPASTDVGAISAGTPPIRRFLCPLIDQNPPEANLRYPTPFHHGASRHIDILPANRI